MLVRYGQTAQARMLLAEKGLPSSANAGYELFDKLGSMGLTSFMQEVTRVRALEGEIARTIQAMKGVKAARVHIVLPDTGSFRRSRQTPSASVIVRTETAGDFSLAPAIRHLVAAAVPGLTVDQVTVLNTDGTILASGGDGASAAPAQDGEPGEDHQQGAAGQHRQDARALSGPRQLRDQRRRPPQHRQAPDQRDELQPRVSASSARCASSRRRAARRTPTPSAPPSASSRTCRPSRRAATSGDQSKRTNERREELTNYEVGTKTTSTVSEGYRIEASPSPWWSIASGSLAALGDKAGPEAVDKQLKEVERLVASAAGIDAKRGDRITVSALEFVQGGQALEPVAVDRRRSSTCCATPAASSTPWPWSPWRRC